MAFDVFTSAPTFQHTFHFWRIAQATHPLGNVIFLISTRYYLPINVFILFRGALFFCTACECAELLALPAWVSPPSMTDTLTRALRPVGLTFQLIFKPRFSVRALKPVLWNPRFEIRALKSVFYRQCFSFRLLISVFWIGIERLLWALKTGRESF